MILKFLEIDGEFQRIIPKAFFLIIAQETAPACSENMF